MNLLLHKKNLQDKASFATVEEFMSHIEKPQKWEYLWLGNWGIRYPYYTIERIKDSYRELIRYPKRIAMAFKWIKRMRGSAAFGNTPMYVGLEIALESRLRALESSELMGHGYGPTLKRTKALKGLLERLSEPDEYKFDWEKDDWVARDGKSTYMGDRAQATELLKELLFDF